MRKMQLYLTEEQYRLLRQRAGEDGSMARVVRDLIDDATRPKEPTADPFYRRVLGPSEPSGSSYSGERAKRDLYRRPR